MKTSNKIIFKTVGFFFAAAILIIFFAVDRNSKINSPSVSFSSIFYNKEGNKRTYQILPQNTENKLELLFFGDIMLDRNVKSKIDKNGIDYLVASSTLHQLNLLKYDLVSANLEGAVIKNGNHYNPVMAYDFAFDPKNVQFFKNNGFNYFTIANNHLADQGENGIIETRDNLKKLELKFSGCKDRETGECSYEVYKMGGKRIGMVGFSMVYGEFDRQKALGIIKNLTDKTDFIVVNIHWGVEYEHKFNRLQQTIGHELIDNGADIIIGHHPHVVQGMEIYKKKPIFYSLGNFIFDQYFSADTQEGLSVAVSAQEKERDLLLIPIKSKAGQAMLMSEQESRLFFDKFLSWSAGEDLIIKEGKIKINESNN